MLQNQSNRNPVNPRPVFLTILCVASFLGCANGIFAGIGFFATSGTMRNIFSRFPGGEQTSKIMDLQMELQQPYIIMGLICTLFSLLGVLLMFKLKRVGFLIYTLAEIILWPYAYFQMRLSNSMMMASVPAEREFPVEFFTSMSEGLSWVGYVGTIVFDIAFIVLYAVNLKHMKKLKINFSLKNG